MKVVRHETCKTWFALWFLVYICLLTIKRSAPVSVFRLKFAWCECCQSRVLCHLLWLRHLMQNRSSCKTLPSSATRCTLQHRQSKWFCLRPFAEFGSYRTVSFSTLQAISPTLLLWTRSSSSCSSSTTMVLKSSVVQFWLWLVTPLPVYCNSPRPGLSAGLVCFIWRFVVLLFYLWLDLFVSSSDLVCFCQCQIVWVGVCLSICYPSTPHLICHTLDLQQPRNGTEWQTIFKPLWNSSTTLPFICCLWWNGIRLFMICFMMKYLSDLRINVEKSVSVARTSLVSSSAPTVTVLNWSFWDILWFKVHNVHQTVSLYFIHSCFDIICGYDWCLVPCTVLLISILARTSC